MQPTFETQRLILRPFQSTDASNVQELAGDMEVARTTLSIPHPYPDGAAESWIGSCRKRADDGEGFPFALISKESNTLIGCMSLNIDKSHVRGELAYWVGKPFWGNGYATEAAKQLIDFGFEDLLLNKIWAAAMTRNPASSNVMKKAGMRFEGEFKRHILKWDKFEDLVFYGLTRIEYEDRCS
jgi:[ribosomal protein S5]-alanine N-acetyltransferase